MYFVKRGENYIDVAGSSFRAFFEGRNNSLPGERPTLSDWANHLSTIFPEVRLKRYLEMRGADGVPWGQLPALPAFWVGLLYDNDSLDAAWNLVNHWTAQERQALRDDVPRFGFKARIKDRYLFEIARECLKLSHAGLRRRNRIDHLGRDESRHLEPLERILELGRTPGGRDAGQVQRRVGRFRGARLSGIRFLIKRVASFLGCSSTVQVDGAQMTAGWSVVPEGRCRFSLANGRGNAFARRSCSNEGLGRDDFSNERSFRAENAYSKATREWGLFACSGRVW